MLTKNMNRLLSVGTALAISAVILGTYAASAQKPTPTPKPKTAVAKPTSDAIPYEVVEKWRIPNGGYGQVIVVDPKFRNEADLKRLAKRLRTDTLGARHADITIYDDKVAASRRREAANESLGKNEMAHHDRHLIGFYNRNINTGNHVLKICLQGIMGPWKEIRQ